MSIAIVPYPNYYSDRWNYSILAQVVKKKRLLCMQVPTSLLYTSSLPTTHALLSHLEPRVLQTKCFNTMKLPFAKEVLKTETAHLFEHILLEYLCQEYQLAGLNNGRFSGWTQWNWKKDTKGVFHITITGSTITDEQFSHALARSVLLFETILSRAQSEKKIINPKQIELDYLFVNRLRE